MSKHGSRHGSLQFYPRVRAKKIIMRVNWDAVKDSEKPNFSGFIGYKVGMTSVYAKDNTAHSPTKGQKIVFPATIIECPSMKILSVRFYKNGVVKCEILNQNIDKELKRKLKLPKKVETKLKLEEIEKKSDFDDARIIVYSQVKKTGIKKAPDIAEIDISGTLQDKLNFIKNNLEKEIQIKDVFKEGVIDIRGVTIGKGFQGATKRFGLDLLQHKSEKGVRGAGTLGPWHPARVIYTVPMAGQMGFFSRINYNNKILEVMSIKEKDINPAEGFKHFGKIQTDYIIVNGSVAGPSKRQLLLTSPIRPSKKQTKKNYEIIELR
jgi:large subunit ribosomal protein L3